MLKLPQKSSRWRERLQPALVLAVILCIGLADSLQAARFEAGFDQADWESESSIFECRMSQMVPNYGQVVFYRRAGEPQQFFLDTKTVFFKRGKGSLQITGPVWKPRSGVQNLGYIDVKESKRPVTLGPKLAERIMAELGQGQQVVITRKPWYGASESLSVAFNSLNYRPVYDDYIGCVAGLLPVNFDQVERTTLYFGGSREVLSEQQKASLDRIVIYVKADAEVNRYVIDGHTDSRGIMAENLELSKKRAEQVADYLLSAGLDESKIQVRWHGERYPIAPNRNAKGRSVNRRVTVRLEKGEASMDMAAR